MARDNDAVLDRISGTVRLNMLCRRGGERWAIADRFVPVIQGWHPYHYLRCTERMPWVLDYPLVGIGSMCRRHVYGEHGILHMLDVLDRAFSTSTARFHVFGLKSRAIAIASQHPRVASADSQAYRPAERPQGPHRKIRCDARARHELLVPAAGIGPCLPAPPPRYPRATGRTVPRSPHPIQSKRALPPQWSSFASCTRPARSSGRTSLNSQPSKWRSWMTDSQQGYDPDSQRQDEGGHR